MLTWSRDLRIEHRNEFTTDDDDDDDGELEVVDESSCSGHCCSQDYNETGFSRPLCFILLLQLLLHPLTDSYHAVASTLTALKPGFHYPS